LFQCAGPWPSLSSDGVVAIDIDSRHLLVQEFPGFSPGISGGTALYQPASGNSHKGSVNSASIGHPLFPIRLSARLLFHNAVGISS
jgi:hypothetical protein